MKRYGNKTNLCLSIDLDIKQLFTSKFGGQTSYLVESFMRDMIGIDSVVIDPKESEEEQLNKLIQEASAEQHKAALKIRAAELRKKQIVETKVIDDKNKIIEQRQLDAISYEEIQARNFIRNSNDDMKFKLAQEQAAKQGRTITAREFLAQVQQ